MKRGDRDGQRRLGEKKERETGKMKENEGYRDIRVSKIQSLAFQSTDSKNGILIKLRN